MKLLKLLIIISLLLPLSLLSQQNSSKDIDDIISHMTLEEKIDFIGGYESFNIRGYEHLGIPEIRFADGPVGVRNYGKSTSYPASITLAASFDKNIAEKVGKAIAMEARAKNVHVMLGPGMNIYRMPLNGRNFEYLGEDPYLAGELASAYTIGMQSEGVVATAKHYVANNQEFQRHHVSSDMDERTLHEIYLPAFKTTVKKGNVAAIMTAYNLINGIHASEHNHLVNEILKDKWSFEGFVMSDWVSTYDGAACAIGGLDLEMPSGKMMNRETLIPLVKDGTITEDIIDDKIRRILRVYDRFDFFNNPDLSKGYTVDENFVRNTSLEAARGGMVLLKNKNNSLPLDKNNIKKIAIIGPNATKVISGGGGSSYVDPLFPVSWADAIKQIAGNDIEVKVEPGVFTGVELPSDIFDQGGLYTYKNEEKVPGVLVEYYKGMKLEGDILLSKYYDKFRFRNVDMWNEPEVPETEYSARFTCYYTPEETGKYIVGISGDDGYKVFLDGKEVISVWRDQGDSPALAECKLEAGKEYKLVTEFYQNGGDAVIRMGVKKGESFVDPETLPDKAIAAAKDADIVIFAGGFSGKTESEGFDRTFEMPYNQSDLINKLAEVNPNLFVVLNSGGNVEMRSWIDNVKGLLHAWYPGQEGNLAAAEILFGITNPSGKLPASFAKTIEENPCYNTYFDKDGDLKVFYDEGIFMGYRYWDKIESKPRFPFGYGLSYTTFSFDKLDGIKDNYGADETVKFSVDISNTGEKDGAEAIQVYIADIVSKLPRPVKELKDFAKIFLKSGESKSVEFSLTADAFKYYDAEVHDWVLEAGEFEIMVGNSSDNILLTRKITIE